MVVLRNFLGKTNKQTKNGLAKSLNKYILLDSFHNLKSISS